MLPARYVTRRSEKREKAPCRDDVESYRRARSLYMRPGVQKNTMRMLRAGAPARVREEASRELGRGFADFREFFF